MGKEIVLKTLILIINPQISLGRHVEYLHVKLVLVVIQNLFRWPGA
jgi:hypothetical protein